MQRGLGSKKQTKKKGGIMCRDRRASAFAPGNNLFDINHSDIP